MAELPKKEKEEEIASWLVGVLSDQGRAKLISAMRRRRADAKPGGVKRRALVLPLDTLREIERLQERTGIPLPRMPYSLAFIANADKKLQEKVQRLSIAIS